MERRERVEQWVMGVLGLKQWVHRRKKTIMEAVWGILLVLRGRSGFRLFLRTSMIQNRPHYWDIISIHTLPEPLGALLGKIRLLSLVNILPSCGGFLNSGHTQTFSNTVVTRSSLRPHQVIYVYLGLRCEIVILRKIFQIPKSLWWKSFCIESHISIQGTITVYFKMIVCKKCDPCTKS